MPETTDAPDLDDTIDELDDDTALPKRRPSRLDIALAALLVAALAAAIFFFVQGRSEKSLADARDAAQQAACANASAWTNFDFAKFDDWRNSVLAGATGEWRDEFDKSSNGVRDLYTKGQLKSASIDLQCAVKSGDKQHAEVVVGIGQTVASVVTAGNTARFFVVYTMDNVDGRWLASKLYAPGANGATTPAPAPEPPK